MIQVALCKKKNWTLEIGPPNCIYSFPESVLECVAHLAPRNIMGKIWDDFIYFSKFSLYEVFH